MKVRSHLLTPGALLFLSSVLLAQQEPVLVGTETRYVDWPPGFGTTGVVTRGVSLELTGDQLRDALLIAGQEAYLIASAGSFNAFTRLPVDAFDADRLYQGVVAGQDAAVVVNASGLYRVSYDTTGDPALVAEAIDTDDWVGAVAVRGGDVDGADWHDVVGLDVSRQVFLTRLSQQNRDLDAGTSFNVPPLTIDKFELVDWNGAAGDEIVAVSADTVRVFAIGNPVPLAAYANSSNVVGMVPLRVTGTAYVAWTTYDSVQELATLHVRGADGYSYSRSIGDRDVVSLATGDYDKDGRLDLYLSHRSDADVLVYFNDDGNGGPSFDADGRITLGTWSGPMPNNRATPVLTDLDGDLDDDLLFPVEETEQLFFYSGIPNDQEAMRPVISNDQNLVLNEGTMSFALSLAPVAGLTDVQLRAWTQADFQAGGVSPSASTPVYVDVNELNELSIELPINDGSDAPDETVYFVEIRGVNRAGNGTVRHSFPARLLAFAMGDDAIAYLEAISSSTATIMLEVWATGGGQGGADQGGFVYVPDIGPFDDGDVPADEH